MTAEEIKDFSSLNPHKVTAKKMHSKYLQNLVLLLDYKEVLLV